MAFEKGDPRINRNGRPRGARNKVHAAMMKEFEKRNEGGQKVAPLEFMLEVLNDPASSLKAKMWAAQNAAPFMHAKMPVAMEGSERESTTATLTSEQIRLLDDEELEALMHITNKLIDARS